MRKEILMGDIEDIIDPQDRWEYPKNINNSLDASIAEEFGYLDYPISCKRCGKEFKRKYREQVFCSRECVRKYRNKINEMIAINGKEFKEWLNDTIDYSYAPEKF